MLQKEIQELIKSLPLESQKVVEAIAMIYESHYESKINALEKRVKELEDQISKDSNNSSKPPSSNEFNKKPKSVRGKSGLKAGGQKGHKGTTLKTSEKPDEIKEHKVCSCENCNKNLSSQQVERIEHRQVYDIPPIQMKVTEHRSEVKVCSCGHVNKAFPSGVIHHIQYGPNIKSMVVYLQDYQLLPYERTTELVKDLFGHQISKGTLYNFRKSAFDQLETFEEKLKSLLTSCLVLGFDETGFRIMAQRLWLHSCSTSEHAYYQVHEKRGQLAMTANNILPQFRGIAVHDFWKSYYKYSCQHALCNAHLLRDLIFIKERFKQDWAEKLIKLLLKMKKAKERAILKGKSFLSKPTLQKYQKQYDEIVDEGLKENPFEPPREKKRGRPKKTPP